MNAPSQPGMTLPERLERAQDFIWRTARLLDRQLYAHLFDGGPRESVLAALRPYQNDDGGFGNCLEPDMRCPTSQPVSTETAFIVLDWIDAFDDPMVGRALDFLTEISTPEGGVPLALPSVHDYPAAPWWTEEHDPSASLNPTASIAGLLLKHGLRHAWLEGATRFCWEAIGASETVAFHELMPMITFLEHVDERERADRELERIVERMRASDAVAYDPEAEGYVKFPLDWAPMPASFCRRLCSDDVLAQHQAALAARQKQDGGWPINWPALSPAVESEWRGWKTVEALRTLRAYGEL